MEQLPHTYSASVAAKPEGAVQVSAAGVPTFDAAPPPQFGGPGDQWSPEDLLMASLSSCMVLSFRAIAGMNKLDWSDLQVVADGELDKVERYMKFTSVSVTAKLVIGAEEDLEKAEKLLHKAEASCFISNSLNCERALSCEVTRG